MFYTPALKISQENVKSEMNDAPKIQLEKASF